MRNAFTVTEEQKRNIGTGFVLAMEGLDINVEMYIAREFKNGLVFGISVVGLEPNLVTMVTMEQIENFILDEKNSDMYLVDDEDYDEEEAYQLLGEAMAYIVEKEYNVYYKHLLQQ